MAVLKFGNTRNLISDYKLLNISIGQQIISEGRLQNEAFLILKKEFVLVLTGAASLN